MLHYSNASSIEKNRRYLVIKGGLAWLLRQEGGVVGDVVDHSGIIGLGVYRREEGEETVNIKQHSTTKHNMAIRCAGCDLTR